MNAWRKYRQYRTAVETVPPAGPDGDALPGYIVAMETAWAALPVWLRGAVWLVRR